MKKFILLLFLVLIFLSLFAFSQSDPEGYYLEDNNFLYNSNPYVKWSDDITVTIGTIAEYDFAYDYNNAICYAIYKQDKGGTIGDTLWIVRSYDLGETWTSPIVAVTNNDGYLFSPNIEIANEGKVACFVIYAETNGTRVIYMREYEDTSLTNVHWEMVSEGNPDTVLSFDVDYMENYYYVTYMAYDSAYYDDYAVYGITCHEDSNTNWSGKTSLFVDPVETETPKISVGKDGYAYVAFIEKRIHLDTLNIRVKRTFDYGASWVGSVPATNLTAGQQISHIDIAANKYDSNRLVWITTQYDNYTNWGVYYSSDSCATTNYIDIFSMGTGWTEKLGSVEAHPRETWATFTFLADSSDIRNIVFFYIMNTDPTAFLDTAIINDNNADSLIPPLATNKAINSAVLYVGDNGSNLYFDSYDNISNVSNNNIDIDNNKLYLSKTVLNSNENISIMYTSDKNTNAELKVFNISGQIVYNKNINIKEGGNTFYWNCIDNNRNKLSSGIYLINIKSDKSNKSSKVTIIK